MKKHKKITLNNILPEDTDRAMTSVISYIDDLQSVIEQETESLEASDTRGFLALQDKKMAAAQLYQQGLTEIIARKDELKSHSPAKRKTLKDKQIKFQNIMNRNVEALDRMKRSSERLGNLIIKAARDHAKEQQRVAYNNQGTFSCTDRRGVSSGSISEQV